MTEDEKAEFKRLSRDPAFKQFLYRLIRDAGLFSVGGHTRGLEFAEGRRSLALDVLASVEALEGTPSPDGLPILCSIQILLTAAQSASKEKNLGRRNDPYRDISDGDDGPE